MNTEDEQTDLSRKMRSIADRDGLPTDHDMYTTAQQFDDAVLSGIARKILGAWARARKVYCDYTGDNLI